MRESDRPGPPWDSCARVGKPVSEPRALRTSCKYPDSTLGHTQVLYRTVPPPAGPDLGPSREDSPASERARIRPRGAYRQARALRANPDRSRGTVHRHRTASSRAPSVPRAALWTYPAVFPDLGTSSLVRSVLAYKEYISIRARARGRTPPGQALYGRIRRKPRARDRACRPRRSAEPACSAGSGCKTSPRGRFTLCDPLFGGRWRGPQLDHPLPRLARVYHRPPSPLGRYDSRAARSEPGSTPGEWSWGGQFGGRVRWHAARVKGQCRSLRDSNPGGYVVVN